MPATLCGGEKESENTNLLAKLNKSSYVHSIEKFFSNNYIQHTFEELFPLVPFTDPISPILH